MFRLGLVLLVIWGQFALGGDPKRIRVRIVAEAPALKLVGSGIQINSEKFGVENPNASIELRIRRACSHSSCPWVVQSESYIERFLTDRLKVHAGSLVINDRLAPKQIELVPGKGRGIDAIATLSLERYIQGVLPSEMPAFWPKEALKAQAVASRSYAVGKLNQSSNPKAYDVDSTVQDQVFRFDNRHLPQKVKRKIQGVLNETKGVVLRDKKGDVLSAFYHADSGGQTENSKDVWKGLIGFPSVKDSDCVARSETDWTLSLRKDELEKKLADLAPEGRGLKKIHIASKTSSGRVKDLRLYFENGVDVKIPAVKIRKRLGYFKMKSTWFSIALTGDAVIFFGKGHGHGVGMCQKGTRCRAEKGWNFEKILSHYYPGAQLSHMTE